MCRAKVYNIDIERGQANGAGGFLLLKEIYVDIELDGIITVKRLKVPIDIIYDYTKANDYIRSYFSDLGYKVGPNLRVC